MILFYNLVTLKKLGVKNLQDIFFYVSYLDLNGLLRAEPSGESPPADEDGEHVDLPQLPVQWPLGVEQAAVRQVEHILPVYVGDEPLRRLEVLQQVAKVRYQNPCNKTEYQLSIKNILKPNRQ